MSTMTQVSDATGRITVRRRRNRRRRWLWIGVVTLVLALLAGAGWLVLGSNVLGVRAVEVSGNRIANTDDVRRLAEVPQGTPLARVDLDAVATRVAGLPAVKSVQVARGWPNTINVRITERAPLFAIETPGGYWIADDEGVVFTSAADADGLMVATVPSGDARMIKDLGTVLSALPAALRNRVEAAQRRHSGQHRAAPRGRGPDRLGQRRPVRTEGAGGGSATQAAGHRLRRLGPLESHRPVIFKQP